METRTASEQAYKRGEIIEAAYLLCRVAMEGEEETLDLVLAASYFAEAGWYTEAGMTATQAAVLTKEKADWRQAAFYFGLARNSELQAFCLRKA